MSTRYPEETASKAAILKRIITVFIFCIIFLVSYRCLIKNRRPTPRPQQNVSSINNNQSNISPSLPQAQSSSSGGFTRIEDLPDERPINANLARFANTNGAISRAISGTLVNSTQGISTNRSLHRMTPAAVLSHLNLLPTNVPTENDTTDTTASSTENIVENIVPTSQIHARLSGENYNSINKAAKKRSRPSTTKPSEFYLTNRDTPEICFSQNTYPKNPVFGLGAASLPASVAGFAYVGQAMGAHDPSPKVIVTLNDILAKTAQAQVEVDGKLTTVDGLEVIPSSIPLLKKLARYCNLYTIAMCDSPNTEQSYLDILHNEGIFASGLKMSKALFCTTEVGRKAIIRQIEPKLCVESDKKITSELKPFVEDLVYIDINLSDDKKTSQPTNLSAVQTYKTLADYFKAN